MQFLQLFSLRKLSSFSSVQRHWLQHSPTGVTKYLQRSLCSLCTLWAVESAPTPGDPMKEYRPQCPVLNSPAQLLLTHTCAYCIAWPHLIFILSLFPLPSTFPQHHSLFKGDYTMCKHVSGLVCLRTCLSFWWSKVSRVLSPNTMVQMNHFFFLSAFFTVQLSHLYIVTGITKLYILRLYCFTCFQN